MRGSNTFLAAASRLSKSALSALTARSWCSPLVERLLELVLVLFQHRPGFEGLVRQVLEALECADRPAARRGLEHFEVVRLVEHRLGDLEFGLLAADAVHGEVVRPEAAERAAQEEGQDAADEADAEQQFMADAPARGHARPPCAAAAFHPRNPRRPPGLRSAATLPKDVPRMETKLRRRRDAATVRECSLRGSWVKWAAPARNEEGTDFRAKPFDPPPLR
jgi:hypothetical protein